MFTLAHRGFLLATFSCLSAAPLFAQSPGVASQVSKLLDTAWEKPTPSAYDAALKQYLQIKAIAPNDIRGSLAIALIAAKNHRLGDAAKYLDEALANGKP